jgi:hypothetical protein
LKFNKSTSQYQHLNQFDDEMSIDAETLFELLPTATVVKESKNSINKKRIPPDQKFSQKRTRGRLESRVALKSNSFPLYNFEVPNLGQNLVMSKMLVQSYLEQVKINILKIQSNLEINDCRCIMAMCCQSHPELYNRNRSADSSGIVRIFLQKKNNLFFFNKFRN